MGVTTERYIRKPLYVDAVRVSAQNFEAVAAWCSGEIQKETEGPRAGKSYIRVRVQYPKSPRQSKAFIGDWVLYTETGYKVYTNPAFRRSFDPVEQQDEAHEVKELPASPAVVEEAEIKSFGPVAEEPNPETGVQPIESVEHAPDVARSPAVAVDEHTTPQGEPHEYVEATPEAIAAAVSGEQPIPVEPVSDDLAVESSPTSPPVESSETPQPESVSEQPPEVAAAGKRVLSLEEQEQMGPDQVRELLGTGEVVLAQDLAA